MPQRLIEGVRKFQASVFPQKKDLFEQLNKGQKPHSVFITCSDSRIDPYLLTSSEPGDLFVIRTAGNIVPPKGGSATGESATMEYAVSVLKVRDIVVCGHAHCGAMDALTKPGSTDGLGEVANWIAHSGTTREEILAQGFENDAARIEATVKSNVLLQLDHLRTYDFVRKAIDNDQLILMGWYYDFGSGRVECYDPETNMFRDLFDGSAEEQIARQRPKSVAR